jgi:hypothetical protein
MNIQKSINSTEHQVCNVYNIGDFLVTSGVNLGDAITNASDSYVGDTYVFSTNPMPLDLVVRDAGFGVGNDSRTFDDIVTGQTVGSGSEIGTLGDGMELESRLTFIGADGSKADVLIINNTGQVSSAWSGEYFLPMSPLTPGIEYTLIKADANPGVFKYSDYKCVCFSRGTMIRMADGSEKLIEHLTEGDLVDTQDNGAQKVRWVGGRVARAFWHLAPVVISKGALGNQSDLIVSQQHRILISDWRAEVMLGSHEVLVKAKDLVNGDTIYTRQGGVVEYFHILFDSHEIVFAEGIPTESLYLNKSTLDSMDEEAQAEIMYLFPELETHPQLSAVAGRISLKSYEAAALLKQVGMH